MEDLQRLNNSDFICRLQNGFSTAYQELEKYLFPMFRNYVVKKFNVTIEDSFDIVQEVATIIDKKINDKFDPIKGEFVPWTFKILEHHCIDWLKSKKSKRKLLIIPLEESHLELPDECPEPEIDDPEDEFVVIENLTSNNNLRQAFLNLKPRYREVLCLWLQEKTSDDICKIMNIGTKEAFWTLKSRALTTLKEEYEKYKRHNEVIYEKA